MGLATIDPHSLKEHIKIYKIPKFGVNRPNSKQDTAIWKCQNLQRNVWRAGQLWSNSVLSVWYIFSMETKAKPWENEGIKS